MMSSSLSIEKVIHGFIQESIRRFLKDNSLSDAKRCAAIDRLKQRADVWRGGVALDRALSQSEIETYFSGFDSLAQGLIPNSLNLEGVSGDVSDSKRIQNIFRAYVQKEMVELQGSILAMAKNQPAARAAINELYVQLEGKSAEEKSAIMEQFWKVQTPEYQAEIQTRFEQLPSDNQKEIQSQNMQAGIGNLEFANYLLADYRAKQAASAGVAEKMHGLALGAVSSAVKGGGCGGEGAIIMGTLAAICASAIGACYATVQCVKSGIKLITAKETYQKKRAAFRIGAIAVAVALTAGLLASGPIGWCLISVGLVAGAVAWGAKKFGKDLFPNKNKYQLTAGESCQLLNQGINVEEAKRALALIEQRVKSEEVGGEELAGLKELARKIKNGTLSERHRQFQIGTHAINLTLPAAASVVQLNDVKQVTQPSAPFCLEKRSAQQPVYAGTTIPSAPPLLHSPSKASVTQGIDLTQE